MFSESEYDYLFNEYMELHKEKMKKHKQISVLSTIALVALVFGLYLLDLARLDPFNILIPLYGGLGLIGLSFYMLYSFGTGSSRAFYDFVVQKVIDKINFNHELELKYSSDKKTEFKHNKKSGLFSRHCKSVVRMYISGYSKAERPFELYELSLITGAGNSQQTHLNGIYIKLGNSTKVIQQIRTHGRPHLKGTSYQKVEAVADYKVYLKEGMFERDLNENYLDLFSRVTRELENQKVYLSVIEHETHFAMHPFKLYKYRKLTLENLNTVYDKINELILLVDDLHIKEF